MNDSFIDTNIVIYSLVSLFRSHALRTGTRKRRACAAYLRRKVHSFPRTARGQKNKNDRYSASQIKTLGTLS
uniref:Uncharacterized protein n=1 Tax=Candidatus Kentrum sp. FW TaxID=2126338 RepID=A0A450SEJ5_9GAMM|nr:MAG: hypothetical protein BECKFW1821A_GA0114235_103012 [Candidatus Kentron sp. FW]VFJ66942.1 MAG: hypothetical protein BECKFW1821B_GA0114236_112312 [Candidatus Kentron sp. FW]